MPKPHATEDALAQVRAIRNPAELIPFLRHKSNYVVAAAADVAKRMEASELAPALIAAFETMMAKPAQRDPGCRALIAIAEALVTMGEDAADAYLAGIQHVQKEGSFGPPVDVAAPLRGLCARGLIRIRHPEALYATVAVLTDPEIAARAGAAAALADANSRDAELLLRLKVLQGDDPEVLSACFTSLLQVAPHASLPFVARYLASDQEALVEAAALALGESRLPGALEPFQSAYARHRQPALRRVILLSIAMLRNPAGVEFLIERLEKEPEALANDALAALALYRNDDGIQARVREIAERRGLRTGR